MLTVILVLAQILFDGLSKRFILNISIFKTNAIKNMLKCGFVERSKQMCFMCIGNNACRAKMAVNQAAFCRNLQQTQGMEWPQQ